MTNVDPRLGLPEGVSRPPEVQAMIDALIALEIDSLHLAEQVQRVRQRFELDGGLPTRFDHEAAAVPVQHFIDVDTGETVPGPTAEEIGTVSFAWWDFPEEIEDAALKVEMLQREQAAAAESSRHKWWTRERDRLWWIATKWRRSIHAARTLVPRVQRHTDDQRVPSIDRWSAGLMRELARLGGQIDDIRVGPIPKPDSTIDSDLREIAALLYLRTTTLKAVVIGECSGAELVVGASNSAAPSTSAGTPSALEHEPKPRASPRASPVAGHDAGAEANPGADVALGGGSELHQKSEPTPKVAASSIHAPSAGDESKPSFPRVVCVNGPTAGDLATAAGVSDTTLLRVRKAAGLFEGERGAKARRRRFAPGEVDLLIRAAADGDYLERARMIDTWRQWGTPANTDDSAN